VVELASIVRSAVERAAPAATELGVELTGEASEGALALADPERLLQAVSNLVENALRSIPAGGRVWVRAEGSAIRVEDTGPGLSAEDLPRAFDRFYLHDRYGGDRTVGSGLGLAIVRELTEAMGGTVTAARRPEGGSIFTIEVPRT
jgi:two-component system sensor histidine kinase BaeS